MVLLALTLGLASGCGDGSPAPPGPAVHQHEHRPPHGGTPVVLGDEECHVELVLNASSGRIEAYVLDGEMENFVRVIAESFVITAKLPDRQESLLFKAVPSNATGETVGDSSEFAAQADWLKNTKSFDGVLKELTVKGKTYRDVPFNFPKGNDKN